MKEKYDSGPTAIYRRCNTMRRALSPKAQTVSNVTLTSDSSQPVAGEDFSLQKKHVAVQKTRIEALRIHSGSGLLMD